MLPKWLQTDAGKIITGLVLVFIPIISYTLLFPFYQNCINLKFVMLIYIMVGATLGAGIAFWLKDNIDTLIERFQLFVAAIVLGMILVPMLATFINRIIPFGDPEIINSHVVKVEQYSQSRFGEFALSESESVDGYFVFTIIENEVVRLDADPSLDVEQYEPGSNIEVVVHQGILGLKWVDPNFKFLSSN